MFKRGFVSLFDKNDYVIIAYKTMKKPILVENVDYFKKSYCLAWLLPY